MKRAIGIIALLAVMVLVLSACKSDDETDTATDDPGEQVQQEAPIELEEFVFTRDNFPRIDGSPATIPLAQGVACILLGEPRENVADMMIFTRTTQAFRDLAAGLSDILIVSEPTPDVFDDLAEHYFNIEMAPIAIDALVFIVSESNPVNNITSDQLRDIYLGNITNWQQVGGDDVEITAFQRNEEAASQVLMEKLVMDWQPMADAPIQNFSSVFEMDEAITAIRGFDGSAGAICYTLFYYADVMEMAEGLKIISIDGIDPDIDSIKSGAYPFLNAYYAVMHAGEPED
jgi:phosphate transport system substrate-binding protein